ncbi:MAG: dephospho-CoA kinase [Candidatus Omnitrophica bacterium]|nr:dephospho-CoA kinase [Candidatus Omnitrophota bacterium]
MFVIGITGSLSTGKSTVASMLAHKAKGINLNADQIARRSLSKNGKSFSGVVKLFGKGILSAGSIDRKKLAKIVFVDPKKLKALEKIVHPVVDQEIRAVLKAANKTNSVIVLDVPLLFEAKLDKVCDLVVVVTAKVNEQIKRSGKNLGLSELEAKNRIAAQMPLMEKIRRADVQIDNNKTLNQLRVQVEKLWKKIQPELSV